MIEKYIEKLIVNLPKNITNVKKPLKLDLVLDGGMFNGSYLIGGLYFLKEMERRNYIKIERISGCSIGSVMGFLYFMDSLHLAEELYGLFFKCFQEEHHLTLLTNLKDLLKESIPKNICENLKNRFYITFYNMRFHKKIVKHDYKNIDEVIDCLIRSCFVPFVINGNILYKNKYMDGVNPYIFPLNTNINKDKNSSKRKILYLDLYGYDKLLDMICVKNEKTNIHRILSGMLDIHTFFIKQSNTRMCSYVNEWNIINKIHNYIKLKMEKINFIIISFLLFIKKHLPLEYNETVIYKMLTSIVHDAYHNLVASFCI